MNRFERFQQKLNGLRPVVGTTVANVQWTGLTQKIAEYPFDFLMFDLEHGTLSVESVEGALRVARLKDLPTIVRVPDCVPHLIQKTLDMGADGLLLPRVESVEQVEKAIAAARYAPMGRKGCGGFANLRADDHGSTDAYNHNRLIFIQMESREGLEALSGILDRFAAQIAGVIIGPYDASIMLGTPLKIGSGAIQDYITSVFELCAARAMPAGIFVDDASMIEGYLKMGANIFWVGTEMAFLCQGLNAVIEEFARATHH